MSDAGSDDGSDAGSDAVTHETQEKPDANGLGLEQDMDVHAPLDAEAPFIDEASILKGLTENVRDQEEIERHVAIQADKMLAEQAEKNDHRRMDRVNKQLGKLRADESNLQQRLSQASGRAATTRAQAELDQVHQSVAGLEGDLRQIQHRMNQRHVNQGDDAPEVIQPQANQQQLRETRREFLIRTGKITPFAQLEPGFDTTPSTLQEALIEAEEGDEVDEHTVAIEVGTDQSIELLSHRNLRRPGFSDVPDLANEVTSASAERPTKRRRLQQGSRAYENHDTPDTTDESVDTNSRRRVLPDDSADFFTPNASEALTSTDGEDEAVSDGRDRKAKSRKLSKQRQDQVTISGKEDLSGLDDGNERLYQARLRKWVKRRSAARALAAALNKDASDPQAPVREDGATAGQEVADEEWHLPHPTESDADIKDGFRIPGDIFPSLFEYQKTGTQWLWELYTQQAGGIIGDEMGLGKTIQVISFLAGLHYSRKLTKPIIIVTPATVMKQWVNEFHRWWPPLRVSILHTSGSGMLNVRGEDRMERDIEAASGSRPRPTLGRQAKDSASRIVKTVVEQGHVLVTTYAGLQTYADRLIPIDWEYAVLDEGHKIRNPNTAITIHCKELRTANRLILSGTPMQNNLTELWSLFDFVFPMRLGTLLSFRHQFEIPIRLGGYANASNLEVQTAVECAARLKDAISPFLLQRLKADVAADLPTKSEQVLFCRLTKPQRQAYERYLTSGDVKAIMDGKMRSFAGIEKLRKICNHPDLVDREVLKKKGGYRYGDPAKSGKMQVVKALLDVWKQGGHKTLLFAQQKIVLDILEAFIRQLGGYQYRRMDGDTPIEHRQALVDEFNQSPDLHVFLLTTKVGGLGVNLTGADRVIIFDPDWNPSTDTQARERAWRLGQKREVTIYRLMSAGTIEEKIYHRQLFKQFLANKILKDPQQRQTVPMKDLQDLFSFGNEAMGGTETGSMFHGTETQLDAATPDDALRVRAMVGVAGMEDYVNPDEANGTGASTNDARLMEGILAGSGVHSALAHDEIVNGRGKKGVQADPVMVKREAQRVADQAAKELLKAQEAARHVPVGTPTWTGQYGVTGRPEALGTGRGVGRGGPSSASILAGLQNRRGVGDRSSRSSRTNGHADEELSPKELMKLIRDFLLQHGGQARSQMLVDHFTRMCRSQDQQALFKEMLRKLAVLEKAGRLRGRWVLRKEYKIKPAA
ncbi:MAG: hypothetical protein M1838_005056 [Thelocarpon superellum]|nr:MAG: hypothetical protein M1838_005056 [Thelocarpon superellum]